MDSRKEKGCMGRSYDITSNTTQALEDALLDARQMLQDSVEAFSKAQDRIIKFRFHNKPALPFVSKVSPELIKKIVETLERVNCLEASLLRLGSIPVNDNTP